MITMEKLITRKTPYICTVPIDALDLFDRFYLEKVNKVSVDNFVIMQHGKECIYLNKDLDNLEEIKDIINSIMQSKYFPTKLFDRFQALTDENSDRILIDIYINWCDGRRKKKLHDSALAELKKAKSLRIHWTVKRNKEIIKELFEIGYGIYDEKAKCDSQKGAENAFMYGYLLGTQAK